MIGTPILFFYHPTDNLGLILIQLTAGVHGVNNVFYTAAAFMPKALVSV